jgi:hypothetical protein
VLFPLKRNVIEFRKLKVKSYASLLDYFIRKGYRYIDIHDAFDRYGRDLPVDDLFGRTHYSPLGNQLVARYILQYLSEQKLIDNNGGKRKLPAAKFRAETSTRYSDPDVCITLRTDFDPRPEVHA